MTFSTANPVQDLQDVSQHSYYDSGLEESETPSSKSSSGPRIGPLTLPEDHYERTTPDGSIGETEHPENGMSSVPGPICRARPMNMHLNGKWLRQALALCQRAVAWRWRRFVCAPLPCDAGDGCGDRAVFFFLDWPRKTLLVFEQMRVRGARPVRGVSILLISRSSVRHP